MVRVPSNFIDQHVGMRLRMRRLSVGVSQAELGQALGVTFQQIQKYERGVNRLGASSLFEAANFLSVNVAYFFEGLQGPGAEAPLDEEHERAVRDFLYSSHGARIIKAFSELQSKEVASIIASLLEAMNERNPA